ncbi:MAG: DNA-deoxyinosine glycosylase [Oscillospiraceae bacterium]
MSPSRIVHPLSPLYDLHSRVLILGTMPSPKSREAGFYYSHPRNRFWPTLSACFDVPTPTAIEERRTLALSHGVALWDVLESCMISGASDQSIVHPVPNNIVWLLSRAPIRAIFTTGQTAERLYRRLCQPATGLESFVLPSSSPANCAISFDNLVNSYRKILLFL